MRFLYGVLGILGVLVLIAVFENISTNLKWLAVVLVSIVFFVFSFSETILRVFIYFIVFSAFHEVEFPEVSLPVISGSLPLRFLVCVGISILVYESLEARIEGLIKDRERRSSVDNSSEPENSDNETQKSDVPNG